MQKSIYTDAKDRTMRLDYVDIIGAIGVTAAVGLLFVVLAVLIGSCTIGRYESIKVVDGEMTEYIEVHKSPNGKVTIRYIKEKEESK